MENFDDLTDHETADEVSAGEGICPICKEKIPTRLPYDWERAKGLGGQVVVEHLTDRGWCRGAGKEISTD